LEPTSPRESGPSVFTRLAHLASRAPAVVILGFLVLTLGAGLYGASVSRSLRAAGLEVPVSESSRVADTLLSRLSLGQPDVVVMLHRKDGDVRDPGFASRVLDALEVLMEDEGVATALSYYDTGLPSLVSKDGQRTLVIVDLRGNTSEAVATLRRIEPALRETGAEVEIGGLVPAEQLGQKIAERDIGRAELIALPFAVLLTLLFFRSAVAALLPALIGAFTLAASAALTRLAAEFTEVSVFALNVSAFVGLGLSLDYALLVVQRFREELARGGPTHDAVATTLDTAGRAVWMSGLTVAVSLAMLWEVPVPLVRSIALGGVLAVASAVLGALVLLPALLAWLGPNVDRWRVGRASGRAGPSPFWHAVAGISLRHPWTTAGLCIAVLVTFALPALEMRSVLPDARILPADSDVRKVEEQLADAAQFDPSGIWAIQVVVEAKGSLREPANLRRVRALVAELRGLDGVKEVQTPLAELDPDTMSEAELRDKAREPAVQLKLSRTVDKDLALVSVLGDVSWRAPEAVKLVKAIRALPHPGLEVSVGGPTAQQADVRSTLSKHGIRVALLVVLWNLVVILHGFRSLLVPLKAVIMNVLSLAASYGFLVWGFQDAHLADWLGFEPPGGIDPTIPLVMFAVVFGLSMDYEIFLLTRIREEYLKDGDNERSIAAGMAHTGRTISSAAAILIVVIGAFATGELVFVKEVGLGVAAAIFLDVTIVRALLVPSTMRLLGAWNWWAPAWLRGAVPLPQQQARARRSAV